MQRVGFLMHLKPERIDDYLEVHENVWPEMLQALRDTGWTNFSLFLDRASALVVGYVETDDYERATRDLAALTINTRWQSVMAEYFVEGRRPDDAVQVLEPYFHLA